MAEHTHGDLRRLFDLVIGTTADRRKALLDRECRGDAGLKKRIEVMIAAAEDERFLSSPTAELEATIDGPTIAANPSEREGQMIDRYKLLQPIGEGGFGSVWMAEQREPVKRRVALKIIKLGMDTKQVVARFEAERQALAMMDHPNIAKVLDAGSTETGRPYFVMEYIKGVPILEYCDTDKLDTKSRLELFSSVCHAIQHAHQKGIIHRDIKPSNVLVTMHDGLAVPKVIDFGIAKATNGELTAKTLFTEHRQIIGTPAYMSPEQAEMSGLDIDTRSDIYSLGVLLYELLTGTTPFDTSELMSRGFAEMMRIIREVEPHKPSTRLSALGESASRTAQQRRAPDPQKLSQTLKGDLDWIVMKCLEKDRTRRYETANGLAADIRRHLNDETVTAGAPTAGYKLRKFVRRNRPHMIAGGLVAGALVVATGVSLWFWVSEARQRAEAVKQAGIAGANAAEARKPQFLAEANAAAEVIARTRAEAINAFVTKALQSSDPMAKGSQDTTIAQAMLNAIKEIDSGAFKNDLETEASLRNTIGVILENLGRFAEAQPLYEKALSLRERLFNGDGPIVATSLNNLAGLFRVQGQYAKAEALHARALAIFEKVFGADDPKVATSLNNMAELYRAQGRYAEAEPLFTRALAIFEKSLGPDHPLVATSLNDLGVFYCDQGRYAQAEPFHKRALAITEKSLGPDHPDVAISLSSLAYVYCTQGQYTKAEPLYTRALTIHEKALGPDHSHVATTLSCLAGLYRAQGQYAQAEPLYTRALGIQEKALGAHHAEVATCLNNLAELLLAQGQFARAEPLLTRSLAIYEKALGPDHPSVAYSLHNMALVFDAQGQYARAETLYTRALTIFESALGTDHPNVAASLSGLAMIYHGQGQHARAEPLLVRSLAIREMALEPDHADVADSLSKLARTRHALGKTDEARQAFDAAIAIVRRQSPEGSCTLADLLWFSATARLDNNDAAAALHELEEAIAIAEQLPPTDHPQLKDYRKTLVKCKEAIKAHDDK